ncbi:MAG TPA: hypothetical protein VFE51_09270 [Verrucomicrobiae bacterium]|nr:hypothetical protein [Verrucomicrobiae bacterium]
MKAIYDEVCKRFPEVRSAAFEDNADQPYTVVTMIAEWLSHMPPDAITPELIERVRAFSNWCEEQPRTETATDDILTIWTVGFVEPLFKTQHTRRILTRIVSKETLTEGATYFKSWVGDENYEKALGEYA